jgi:cation transport regulator ChaC
MAPWYFAYGSNLWMDQMIERTGAIGSAEHRPRIARLAGYRLVFQHWENGEPAFANILSPGDGLFGVVYRCSPADLEKLDRYESGYERQPIVVSDQNGEVLPAIAYVVKPAPVANAGKPSAEYLERIITGAKQHGLPEQYVENILAIALFGKSGSTND